ncbi:MAG: calycin-like domain-containing protein [Tannerella sp.]|jgi:hypothetical protein|nr:calycin-like domain-containing protein [Tannerella sp.]
MKSKLFSAMLCLSVLCIGFTACSDDEKEDGNYAKAIAGTYKGSLLMESAPIVSDAQIDVIRDDDRNVTLKMNETVLTMSVDIECKSEVSLSNGQYLLSGSTTFNMSMGEATVPVPVKVNGTIDSAGKANIRISVEVPNLPVEVIFDGQK